MFDIKLYDETGERETIRGLSWSQMTTVQSVIARLHFLIGNKQYKHKSNQVADENPLAALRSEIANYETARQEDAKRLEQVTAERDAMREALKPFAHPDLCKRLPNNGNDDNAVIFVRNNAVITLADCRRAAALKGGKG